MSEWRLFSAFELADGYRPVEKTRKMELEQAVKHLCGRRQSHYTRAVKEGLWASLQQNVLKCPFCGRETPAYLSTLFKENPMILRPRRVKKERLAAWGTNQIGFYDEGEKVLRLSEPLLPEELTCRKCGEISRQEETVYRVYVLERKNLIRFGVRLRGPEDLFAGKWLQDRTVEWCTPLYETVTFNFRNGHTYLELWDESGFLWSVRDITENWNCWQGSPTEQVLARYPKARRKLAAAFRRQGEQPILERVSAEKDLFISATRFVGFPQYFYDGIPFLLAGNATEKSFSAAARKIRTPEMAQNLLKNSPLPQVKSVRRCFYEDPALFFYFKEILALWAVLKDVNLLCDFLQQGKRFDFLMDLHQWPAVLEFIRDAVEVKGAPLAARRIREEWCQCRDYGVFYACLNPRMKREERLRWAHSFEISPANKKRVSSPVTPYRKGQWDCTIKGYRFRWLHSGTDYKTAGRAMNNCLGMWSSKDNPVVTVSKGEKRVAAIEIYHETIMQLHGPHNNPPEENPAFEAALEIWKKRFGVHEFKFDERCFEEVLEDII